MIDDSSRHKGKDAGRSSGNEAHLMGPGASEQTKLDSAAQAQIGRKLKALYDDVVNQPIPDPFKELLEQMEQRRTADKGDLPN